MLYHVNISETIEDRAKVKVTINALVKSYTGLTPKKCMTLNGFWSYGPELTSVSRQSARGWHSHKPSGRLPLLSARPPVTFPAREHHRPLAGTKVYCLVSEAHVCGQLSQSCYLAVERPGIELATSASLVRCRNHYTAKPHTFIYVYNTEYVVMCTFWLAWNTLCSNIVTKALASAETLSN